MDDIIKVTPSEDYKLELVFSDNFKSIIFKIYLPDTLQYWEFFFMICMIILLILHITY